jgi:hypothetical protein
MEALKEKIFAISKSIRYVAIYSNNKLISSQRPELENASSSESDKYEELIVNPTLLKLITQRGNIDCGGMNYVIIRYRFMNSSCQQTLVMFLSETLVLQVR